MFKFLGGEYGLLFDVREDRRFSVFMSAKAGLQHFRPAVASWSRVTKEAAMTV